MKREEPEWRLLLEGCRPGLRAEPDEFSVFTDTEYFHQGTPGAPGAPGNTGPTGKQGELGPPVSKACFQERTRSHHSGHWSEGAAGSDVTGIWNVVQG